MMPLFPDCLTKCEIEHSNRPNAADDYSDCAIARFNFSFFCPLAIRQFEGMTDSSTRVLQMTVYYLCW